MLGLSRRLRGRIDSAVPNLRPRCRRFWLAVLLTVLACLAVPADGFARASGGYSRPGGFSRTPSFGGGGGGVPDTVVWQQRRLQPAIPIHLGPGLDATTIGGGPQLFPGPLRRRIQ